MISPVFKLYRFIGSLPFTLILLSSVSCIVAAGTILESITGSHKYAEQWTYGHPLFFIVFVSLFANILFSATRRWPFKKRHIPFLITHLGLLLMLTGVWIKGAYGLQGHMHLLEGSGSHQVILPNRQKIQVKDRSNIYTWRIHHPAFGKPYASFLESQSTNPGGFAKPDLELIAFEPHGEQNLRLWHQNGYFAPYGMKPLGPQEEHLHSIGETPWLFSFAGKGNLMEKVKTLYPQEARICIYAANNSTPLYTGSLEDALKGPVVFSEATLHLNLIAIASKWQLQCRWCDLSGKPLGESFLELDGPEALENQFTALWRKETPYHIQIERTPSVTLLLDEKQTEWLIVLGPFGSLQTLPFSNDLLEIYSVDRGFGGYLLRAHLPKSEPEYSPSACYKQKLEAAKLQMKQKEESLELPERLFYAACQKMTPQADFANEWICFLDSFKQTRQWLYIPKESLQQSQENILLHLDFSKLPPSLLYALEWSLFLTQELQITFQEGYDLASYIKEMQWPIPIEKKNPEEIFYTLQEQLFTAAFALPPPPNMHLSTLTVPQKNAAFLSLLLRQRKEPFEALLASTEELQPSASSHHFLYCRLQQSSVPLPPLAEKEKEQPWMRCRIKIGSTEQVVDLVYNASEKELAQPVLQGRYLIQALPDSEEIPYHLRLGDAQKIVYPYSDQAVSYEADSLITNRKSGASQEIRLSMNQVHETEDGHRFYLSSIAPGEETAVRQVRLSVSRDPLRSLLIYLGALLVALGTLLLLFRRPA